MTIEPIWYECDGTTPIPVGAVCSTCGWDPRADISVKIRVAMDKQAAQESAQATYEARIIAEILERLEATQ